MDDAHPDAPRTAAEGNDGANEVSYRLVGSRREYAETPPAGPGSSTINPGPGKRPARAGRNPWDWEDDWSKPTSPDPPAVATMFVVGPGKDRFPSGHADDFSRWPAKHIFA